MKKLTVMALLLLVTSLSFAEERGKYYSPSFTENLLIYIMNPKLVGGWCLPLRDYEKKYMLKEYVELPMLGGWRDGKIPDKEKILTYGIKNAFVISDGEFYTKDRAKELEALRMSVLTLNADKLEDYIPLLRDLGRELGVPERGEILAEYGEEALERTKLMTAGIHENEKKRVFWALGSDGLSTACTGAIELAGGVNVNDCKLSRMTVTFEQLMVYDPDVIIAINPVSAQKIMNDPRWQRLRAYKNGQIHIVPFGPFGWLHMPEVTRFMGIQWLACSLYPERCTINIDEEAKKFTKLFMHVELTDADLDDIMHRNKKW